MSSPLPSPGAPRLLLVPTALERRRLADLGGLPTGFALQAVSGFGPIAAAARTAALIERLRPSLVLLVGIAGTYDVVRDPPGTAVCFRRVAVDGVGVGEGARFVGPPALGFPQWPGECGDGSDSARIDDRLPLAAPPGTGDALLLTTCAASDSAEHAAERHRRFPDAVAEDMEGFGVALACSLRAVPCAVVRGMSNAAGNREPTHWRVPAALSAARRLVLELHEDGAWNDLALSPR